MGRRRGRKEGGKGGKKWEGSDLQGISEWVVAFDMVYQTRSDRL